MEEVSDANLVVYVHPSKCNKISQAILRELSSLLFKFNKIFEGVVLAYDVNILDKNAKILAEIHPYFGVRLKGKLLPFFFNAEYAFRNMVRYNKRHKIKVGNMTWFLVKSFGEEILHISGSLIPAHTGSIKAFICLSWV